MGQTLGSFPLALDLVRFLLGRLIVRFGGLHLILFLLRAWLHPVDYSVGFSVALVFWYSIILCPTVIAAIQVRK
jgi:hypothetical protein